MSKQYSREVFGANENILSIPDHFINVPMKIKSENVTADSSGKKILKAGTILSKEGKVVNDGTAYGIVYIDMDLTHVGESETVPVTVHGFINGKKLPTQPSTEALAAMKQITIL